MQLAVGKWITFALGAAAELKLADQLVHGPKTSAEIAAAIGADPARVARVLRALASCGVFRSTPDGRWSQNEASDLLRVDAPGSLRSLVLHLASGFTNRAWERLADAVRGEHDVFLAAHGSGFYEYLEKHPESAAVFDRAMSGHVAETAHAFVSGYDLSRVRRVVDVGGGDGTLLLAILQANPRASGVVLERPRVADVARARFKEAGLSGRAETVAGDFFREIPSGGDLYIVSMVLQDWTDDKAHSLLANVRRVMPREGKLVALGYPIPPGDEPGIGKLMDLEMLVGGGAGAERTEDGYRTLLESAGFEMKRIVALASGASALEAVPAGGVPQAR